MTINIPGFRERLWCAAFGVETLTGLFDMTPIDQAKPVIDSAISAFTRDPDSLRPLLSPDDHLGLRGNYLAIMDIRDRMVRMGGTISGAVEVE